MFFLLNEHFFLHCLSILKMMLSFSITLLNTHLKYRVEGESPTSVTCIHIRLYRVEQGLPITYAKLILNDNMGGLTLIVYNQCTLLKHFIRLGYILLSFSLSDLPKSFSCLATCRVDLGNAEKEFKLLDPVPYL